MDDKDDDDDDDDDDHDDDGRWPPQKDVWTAADTVLASGAVHARAQMYVLHAVRPVQFHAALLRRTSILMSVIGEKNAKSKEMIRSKTAEYMDRAEKLKTHLADMENPNRKKPSAVGSNGKVSNGGPKAKYVAVAIVVVAAAPVANHRQALGQMDTNKCPSLGEGMTTKNKTPTRKSSAGLWLARFCRRSQTSSGRTLLVWKWQRRP